MSSKLKNRNYLKTVRGRMRYSLAPGLKPIDRRKYSGLRTTPGVQYTRGCIGRRLTSRKRMMQAAARLGQCAARAHGGAGVARSLRRVANKCAAATVYPGCIRARALRASAARWTPPGDGGASEDETDPTNTQVDIDPTL